MYVIRSWFLFFILNLEFHFLLFYDGWCKIFLIKFLDKEESLIINNQNRRAEFTITIKNDEDLEPFEFLTVDFVATSTSGEAYTSAKNHLVYIEDNDCN